MLAVSRGKLWLLSTPHGKRGFFYEMWKAGGRGWMRIRVPATECPRISQRFLAEERPEFEPDDAQFHLETAGNQLAHGPFAEDAALVDDGHAVAGQLDLGEQVR